MDLCASVHVTITLVNNRTCLDFHESETVCLRINYSKRMSLDFMCIPTWHIERQ